MRNVIAAAGLLASLTVAEGAWAQGTTPASSTASTSGSGQANVGVSLPGAATTTTAAPGTSDHDQMVGRLAVGYFGIANVGAGANTGAGGSNDSPYLITGLAPVVGVRYWMNQMLGLDVGLGMSVIGGSLKAGDAGTKTNRTSFTGFIIHGGVPLALASADHFTFELIPEANIGFGHAGADPNGAAPGDVSYSGFHFDIGARVGGEIHFGFMKIPQLSLVGSVGLRFDTDSGKTNDTQVPGGGGAPVGKSSSTRSEFHTTVGSNPWAIFTNQIAALYYF
jgi:hypothetical protein